MLLAEVVGTVVTTIKHPAFAGETLLQVQPLDHTGKATGDVVVAIDRAQAGVGDRVLVLREGSGIRQIVGREQGKPLEEAVKMDWPVRSMVVGIVDAVEVAAFASGAAASTPKAAAKAGK